MLILIISVYVYFSFNGTPWRKSQQTTNMRSYLSKKYQTEFIIKTTDYNYLSESYQAYAYPMRHAEELFMVQEDRNAPGGYSDTFPKVCWDTIYSSNLKAKINSLFPSLNKKALNASQIVERGEFFGPNIPTYEEIHASPLSCSITINIRKNWVKMNRNFEIDRIKQLSLYLQTIHLPVLIEIRYYQKQIHINEKVYYLTEDGKIIEK